MTLVRHSPCWRQSQNVVVLVVAALVVVRWLLRAEVLGNFGVIDDSAAKASCPVRGEVSHLRTLIFASLVVSCVSSLVACGLQFASFVVQGAWLVPLLRRQSPCWWWHQFKC